VSNLVVPAFRRDLTFLLILRSGLFAASRRMATSGLSWFETAQVRLLSMKIDV
jgi:hypothetical protein